MLFRRAPSAFHKRCVHKRTYRQRHVLIDSSCRPEFTIDFRLAK